MARAGGGDRRGDKERGRTGKERVGYAGYGVGKKEETLQRMWYGNRCLKLGKARNTLVRIKDNETRIVGLHPACYTD